MATITWIKHASVLLEGKKRIYIDPWELKETKPADLVLITHDHYDHLSPEDLRCICTSQTEILLPEGALAKIKGIKGKFRGVIPGQKIVAAEMPIETVPAYNINKAFHPRTNHYVGYIITIDGERIYHAGDTDFIPEMKGLAPDVALLPIGGTYTMNVEEAAEAAEAIQAKRVIPIHYGSLVGKKEDAQRLKKICKVPVEILPSSY